MDTIKHWCNDCDHLHRVPAHLEHHALCCVNCGGSLRNSLAAPAKRKKTRRAPRRPEPEPVASGTTSAWLKRAAPFMIAALLTACTAAIKIAMGRPLPALVSAMLCLVSCLRVFFIYQEESEEEDEHSYALA